MNSKSDFLIDSEQLQHVRVPCNLDTFISALKMKLNDHSRESKSIGFPIGTRMPQLTRNCLPHFIFILTTK